MALCLLLGILPVERLTRETSRRISGENLLDYTTSKPDLAKERANELEECRTHANNGATAVSETAGFIIYKHVGCPVKGCGKGSSNKASSIREHFLVRE